MAAERARRAGVPCVVVSPCPTVELLAAGPLRLVDRHTRTTGLGAARGDRPAPRRSSLGPVLRATGGAHPGRAPRRVRAEPHRAGPVAGLRLVRASWPAASVRRRAGPAAGRSVAAPLAAPAATSSGRRVCAECGSIPAAPPPGGRDPGPRGAQAVSGRPVGEVTAATGRASRLRRAGRHRGRAAPVEPRGPDRRHRLRGLRSGAARPSGGRRARRPWPCSRTPLGWRAADPGGCWSRPACPSIRSCGPRSWPIRRFSPARTGGAPGAAAAAVDRGGPGVRAGWPAPTSRSCAGPARSCSAPTVTAGSSRRRTLAALADALAAVPPAPRPPAGGASSPARF